MHYPPAVVFHCILDYLLESLNFDGLNHVMYENPNLSCQVITPDAKEHPHSRNLCRWTQLRKVRRLAATNCHVVAMSQSMSDVSDDFEFIETPAAPTPVPPPEDYGVRTTTVSTRRETIERSIAPNPFPCLARELTPAFASILRLRMHRSLPTPREARPSRTSYSFPCSASSLRISRGRSVVECSRGFYLLY